MDLSYFSDFLANLFNIPHEDYEVERDSSDGFTAEYNTTTTDETIEDIEAEVAAMPSETSEKGQSKGAVERKRIEPLEVRAYKFQDPQAESIIDIAQEFGPKKRNVLQTECHVYLKDLQVNSNHISRGKGNTEGERHDDEENKTEFTEEFNNNVGDEIAMSEHGFVTKLCCVRIRKLNLNGGEAQSLHLANSNPSVDKHELDDGRGLCSIDGNKEEERHEVEEENKTELTEDFSNNVGDEITMGEHDFVPKLCFVRIQKLNMNGGEAQSLHLANSSSSVDKHESDHCRGIRGIDGHESLKKSLMLEPRDSSLQLGDVLGCEPIGELIDVETNHGKRRPLDVYEKVDTVFETREEYKSTELDETAAKKSEDDNVSKPQEHCGNESSMRCSANKIKSVTYSVDHTNLVFDKKHLMIHGSQPTIMNQSPASDPKNDILVLDEVYEVGCGTNSSFDEADLNYFNIISKREDNCTATIVKNEVEDKDKAPSSFSQKPINFMKQKVKNVIKTVAKKFCVSKKNNRVIPVTSPRIKSASSSPSPNTKSKDKLIKSKVMEGLIVGKVPEAITGNVLDVKTLYSDNILADFFNPHQPKNETVKKEEFDSSGLAKSALQGVGGNERLSSFKIPKLPLACPLIREEGVKDLEVISNNCKGNQDVRQKAGFTDQMVMVNDEWIKLGEYLKMEGIFPTVDVTQHNSSEYKSPKVETERRLLPLDKDELDDIYHENWEKMREISTDKERKDLSRKVFRNPVPANPSNNLTYHGYRRREKYYEHNGHHSRYRYSRASHPVGSVAIRQGVLDPLPGYKRKYPDIDATSIGCKRTKIEYEYFKHSMRGLYYKKCKDKVGGEKLSQRQFKDFQYFMEHVKDGQEETQNFLSFYCKKAVVLDEVQVNEVIDTESILSQFKLFYGDPDPSKCERCGNTYHLFSQ